MSVDLTQLTIQQQISLNSGAISIANIGGSYQFVNANTGLPLTNNTINAGSFLLANTPGIYQTSLRASVYNYALGLFAGKTVPNEVVDTLAAMATYYTTQTGQAVSTLFNDGVLLDQFMATINNFRSGTSQIGYAGLNTTPSWSNNPVLRASISKAMEPWDVIGTISQRGQYNNEPIGFTFYATDTNIAYKRSTEFVSGWAIYADYEPLWPS
jgi:hypothetical protein